MFLAKENFFTWQFVLCKMLSILVTFSALSILVSSIFNRTPAGRILWIRVKHTLALPAHMGLSLTEPIFFEDLHQGWKINQRLKSEYFYLKNEGRDQGSSNNILLFLLYHVLHYFFGLIPSIVFKFIETFSPQILLARPIFEISLFFSGIFAVLPAFNNVIMDMLSDFFVVFLSSELTWPIFFKNTAMFRLIFKVCLAIF